MDIPKPEGWLDSFELLGRTVTFDQSFSNDGPGGGFAYWRDEADEVELRYHYVDIAPDAVGERVEVWDYRTGIQQWMYQRARVGWQLNPSGLDPSLIGQEPSWDVGPEKYPFSSASPELSEERKVARLAADILLQAAIPGLHQVAIDAGDATLELPAAVVSAHYEGEERALKKSGIYGGRYRLEVELRGMREKPATAERDAIVAAIGRAFQVMPSPVPASAAAFSYYFIDEWVGQEDQTADETRTFRRSYNVYALLA